MKFALIYPNGISIDKTLDVIERPEEKFISMLEFSGLDERDEQLVDYFVETAGIGEWIKIRLVQKEGVLVRTE